MKSSYLLSITQSLLCFSGLFITRFWWKQLAHWPRWEKVQEHMPRTPVQTGTFATFCLELQEYFCTGRSPSNFFCSSTLEINPQVFLHPLFFSNWISHRHQLRRSTTHIDGTGNLLDWLGFTAKPRGLEELIYWGRGKKGAKGSQFTVQQQAAFLRCLTWTLLKCPCFPLLSHLYTSLKNFLILELLLEGPVLEINPRLAKWEAFQMLIEGGWGGEPGKA